ncbi:MAG: hypothetical protein OXE93_02095 [bacterium]|nr:hypothetical protein [bacterium]
MAIVNWDKPLSEFDPSKGAGVHSLRTAIEARNVGGNAGIGAYYEAVGHRAFDLVESVNDINTLKAAATDAGFSSSLVDDALANPATWEALKSEHTVLCDETRSFGVPTIRLDIANPTDGANDAASTADGPSSDSAASQTRPALFGPVISNPPASTKEAVELWQHVRWLTAYDNFSELKRDRLPPNLESYRRRLENNS